MSGRLAEAGVVTALAISVTGLLALPVLRAPTERVFGAEIAGRHHDPFTVMQQFEGLLGSGLYAQPITDLAGALIARIAGGVAAYNVLVLASFPLAAAACYLLARHLTLSWPAAAIVAMAFAFSPFHLAHAAYHPHIAQVQWLPLYLLALWRCLDAATPGAVAALGAATLAVTLSNFYGGLIAAMLTPIAVAAYWLATRKIGAQPMRRLGVTAGSLLVLAAAGLAYVTRTANAVVVDRAGFAFPPTDLVRYGATWWSYLVPPVEHPLLGPAASQYWAASGVRLGLVEQQLSLGWGVIALALVAIVRWSVGAGPAAPRARVPVLVVIAIAALVCSLSPEQTIGAVTVAWPSAWLYDVMPMFRSYARFGMVVQLMAVLLAGIGIEGLLRSGTRGAHAVCMALVVFTAAEYAVSPSALWRDVLPTAAHRWITRQPEPIRAVDCVRPGPDVGSVSWLTGGRVTLSGGAIDDCGEPALAAKLAALGYTHLLMRGDRSSAPRTGSPDLPLVASFPDGQVFAVASPPPQVYTKTMTGFSTREQDVTWSWRWMGAGAYWTIENTTPQPVVAVLALEMSAFHNDRRITFALDSRPVETIVVPPSRRTFRLGPFTIPPGAHYLAFSPGEPPTVADEAIHNRDRRPLSVAVGTWAWHVDADER